MRTRTRIALLTTTAAGLVAVAVLTRPSDVRPQARTAAGPEPGRPPAGGSAEAVPPPAPAVDAGERTPGRPADPDRPSAAAPPAVVPPLADAPPPPVPPTAGTGPREPRGGVAEGSDSSTRPPAPVPSPSRPPTGPPAAGGATPRPADPSDPADGGAGPAVPLPLARDALAMVGADPEAEEVWARAVNDPALPPNARKDLIEDLNEDGFEDPKHLTPDDVPLILSRLALIEDLAPDAMDDVNYAAFAEAYKDLVNMLAKATRE